MIDRVSPDVTHASGVNNKYAEDNEAEDDPDYELSYMSTEFSKWSHLKRESFDAVAGVAVGAPPETHTFLTQGDKNTWSKGPGFFSQSIDGDGRRLHGSGDLSAQNSSQDLGQLMLLRNVLHYGNNGCASTDMSLHGDATFTNDDHSSTGNPLQKGQYGSKRAALVAKNKATSPNTLRTSQSSSVKPSDVEPTLKTNQQQQPGPTILLCNTTDDGCRNAVTLALQAGVVDAENASHSNALFQMMTTLNNSKSDPGSSEQTVEKHAVEHPALIWVRDHRLAERMTVLTINRGPKTTVKTTMSGLCRDPRGQRRRR